MFVSMTYAFPKINYIYSIVDLRRLKLHIYLKLLSRIALNLAVNVYFVVIVRGLSDNLQGL